MDITLVVNGLDLHTKVSTYHAFYEMTYKKVITTLDDTEHPYPGKDRPVVRFSLLPQTDEEQMELYNALKDRVFSATFTLNGVDVTETVRVNRSFEQRFLLKSVDGKRRSSVGEIELRGL